MPSYTCCTQLFGYFSVETSWSRRDMRLGTIFRSKSTTSASNGRGGILRPPPPQVKSPDPASDRVKEANTELHFAVDYSTHCSAHCVFINKCTRKFPCNVVDANIDVANTHIPHILLTLTLHCPVFNNQCKSNCLCCGNVISRRDEHWTTHIKLQKAVHNKLIVQLKYSFEVWEKVIAAGTAEQKRIAQL